jgi:hypothetical protein
MQRPAPTTAAKKFGLILGGLMLVALQAWLLSMVLPWFGPILTFWQCFITLLLFYSIRGNR